MNSIPAALMVFTNHCKSLGGTTADILNFCLTENYM